MTDRDREYVFRAPQNGVQPPPERETRTPGGSVDQWVIARLVWPSKTEFVPARARRWTHDRVLVEWRTNVSSDVGRSSWIPRDDVRLSIQVTGPGPVVSKWIRR